MDKNTPVVAFHFVGVPEGYCQVRQEQSLNSTKQRSAVLCQTSNKKTGAFAGAGFPETLNAQAA